MESRAPRDVPYVDLVAVHAPLKTELLAAVQRVLDHGQFILGPEVQQLEDALSQTLGGGHVVAVGSGTDALRIALQVHGVGPRDEVVTVSHTFVGTVAAIASTGATPVLVDVHPETLSMDPAALTAALTPKTKAVIPVHLSGIPCELDPIVQPCEARGIAVVQDCAQAFGASYRGRKLGSFGTACFSLHPLKSLSACGDGGFVVVPDEAMAREARVLRNNGLVDRDHCRVLTPHSRLDTLQAALLLVKLKYVDDWLQARRAHAEAYRAGLAGHFALPRIPDGAVPAPSAFVIREPRRDALLRFVAKRGFDVKVHYPIAVHQQEPLRGRPPKLPVTERVVDEIVSLPVGPELRASARDTLIGHLQEFATGG